MIEHTFSFDIHYKIERDGERFESALYSNSLTKHIGEITGSIARENGRNIYQIESSDIDDGYRGVGLGYKFYIETIRFSFERGADEFRSSEVINEMSTGCWEKLMRENYNVEKTKKYYVVKREKNII